MTSLWARTGLIWFLATISFGMYLGMTKQFGISSAHAHLGLLGWLSSIAFAFLYALANGEGRLDKPGRIHWGLHNIGVVSMVSGLFTVLKTGDEGAAVFIALGGLVIILATIWLALLLWRGLGARAA